MIKMVKINLNNIQETIQYNKLSESVWGRNGEDEVRRNGNESIYRDENKLGF